MTLNRLLILGVMIIFLAGCVEEETTISDSVNKNKKDANTTAFINSTTVTKNEQKIEIEPNTPIIFYTTYIGSQTNDVSYYDVSEGGLYSYVGTGTPIQWETEYKAIIGRIPTSDKTYVLHRITSPSYAPSYIYSITKNNRVVVFRDWGYPEETDIQDITVIDPENGKTIYSVRLYPSSSANNAIVGENIFYRDQTYYKNSGFGSARTRGGDLYKANFADQESVKLLDYGDSDNSGKLYGIGNGLYSVFINENTNELEFREHSTSTGRIMKTFYKIPNVEGVLVYAGETAFYIVIKAESSSLPLYQIHQLNVDGETKILLNLELDSTSHSIEGVDEEGNYLLISIAKEAKIDSIGMYGLIDDSFKEIDIEPNIQLTHPPSEGNRFILLNQQ